MITIIGQPATWSAWTAPLHNFMHLSVCLYLDEYRVQVQKTYEGDMLYGDYLLKVYNTEIRLFTPNGLIPTTFKCSIEEIHRVKYHPVGPQNCCVIISVKNIQTK